jgi:hypothetical protein
MITVSCVASKYYLKKYPVGDNMYLKKIEEQTKMIDKKISDQNMIIEKITKSQDMIVEKMLDITNTNPITKPKEQLDALIKAAVDEALMKKVAKKEDNNKHEDEDEEKNNNKSNQIDCKKFTIIKIVDGKNAFECAKCSEIFSMQWKLNLHLRRKVPCKTKKFKCDHCESKFVNMSNLKRHKKLHMLENNGVKIENT